LVFADIVARLIARQVQMGFQQFAQGRWSLNINTVKRGGGKGRSADRGRTERKQQRGQIACMDA
jgi:hypothetical protein